MAPRSKTNSLYMHTYTHIYIHTRVNNGHKYHKKSSMRNCCRNTIWTIRVYFNGLGSIRALVRLGLERVDGLDAIR